MRRLTSHRKKQDARDDKKALLKLLAAQLDGDETAAELTEPLEYNPRSHSQAVLVVTSNIDINGIKVTKVASKILSKHAGLSLDSLSHWALVVVDRGDKTCYLYDLMSDQMLPTVKIMKNYPRCFPVTEEMVRTWTGCSYIGETTKEHNDILELGKPDPSALTYHMRRNDQSNRLAASKFISANPKYNLFSNNCQHLTEELVKDLCNGKVISQANLGKEVKGISTKLSSVLLMKIHLNDKSLRELRSDIKTAGDKIISERGSKVIP